VAFLTAAMPLASARESHGAAVESGFQIALRFFPKASESFPALAFLFLLRLLSLSPLFFAPATLLSFAIFSWQLWILASGLEIFSISAKW